VSRSCNRSILQAERGSGRRLLLPKERRPHIVFANRTQSIYLADTTADWHSYLPRLRDRVKAWLDESGNGRISLRRPRWFAMVDDVAAVTVAKPPCPGTNCLVWSWPLSADAGRRLRCLDRILRRRPHLLDRSVNHPSADTRVVPASSMEFCVPDEAADTPWVTQLPIPKQVVARIKPYDYVSCKQLVTRYRSHKGFWGCVEREFPKFGRVDQLYTETFATLMTGARSGSDSFGAASTLPLVLTPRRARYGGLRRRRPRRAAMLLDDALLPRIRAGQGSRGMPVFGDFQSGFGTS
jgi:hypothetical protein